MGTLDEKVGKSTAAAIDHVVPSSSMSSGGGFGLTALSVGVFAGAVGLSAGAYLVRRWASRSGSGGPSAPAPTETSQPSQPEPPQTEAQHINPTTDELGIMHPPQLDYSTVMSPIEVVQAPMTLTPLALPTQEPIVVPPKTEPLTSTCQVPLPKMGGTVSSERNVWISMCGAASSQELV